MVTAKVKDQIRMLYLKYPKDVKQSIMRPENRKLYDYLLEHHKFNTFKARDIADERKCSIQLANAMLTALAAQGYLKRMLRSHPSGGKEYVYNVRPLSNWAKYNKRKRS